MRRRRAWLAAAALALLSGCGGPSSSGSTPPPVGLTVTSSVLTAGSPAPAAWLTYHHDNARSGVDTSSPPLGAPALAWTSPPLDGAVYAEPLVDGRIVLAATEGGSLYGLDAERGQVLWRTHVADPVAQSALPCGDVFPLGITGTPVIDPVTHVAYAVAETGDGRHLLAAVADADGTLLWTRPVDPDGTRPITQQQRAALALVDGRVVVPMGGLFGDCGQYRGYVVSADEGGGGALRSWIVPAVREAGMWATSGAAVDANNGIYVTTGNGEPTATFDHSDSVVRLDTELHDTDYFAPDDWQQLSRDDTDLGSTGVSLVSGFALVAGKDGIAYLLHADHLGGIGGAVASLQVGGGVYGGLAIDGDVAYIPATDGLRAVRVGAAGTLAEVWRGPATWPAIVSGGAVWAMERDSGTLDALDPATGAVRFAYPAGDVEHFTTPTAAAGSLYVAARDHVVALAGV